MLYESLPVETSLRSIPDWSDWKKFHAWLHKGIQHVQRLQSGSAYQLIAVEGKEIAKLATNSPFGWYSESTWRRFAAATFLADLSCYQTPADRVNFERLLLVLHAFPEGFRTWGVLDEEGDWLPVGYSGFYPIAEETFAQLTQADPRLASRWILPISSLPGQDAYVYLFNYSIALPLQKSFHSKRLLSSLAADLAAFAPGGMATIAVSPDGIRVAKRFGLQPAGTLRFGNLTEQVLIQKKGAEGV